MAVVVDHRDELFKEEMEYVPVMATPPPSAPRVDEQEEAVTVDEPETAAAALDVIATDEEGDDGIVAEEEDVVEVEVDQVVEDEDVQRQAAQVDGDDNNEDVDRLTELRLSSSFSKMRDSRSGNKSQVENLPVVLAAAAAIASARSNNTADTSSDYGELNSGRNNNDGDDSSDSDGEEDDNNTTSRLGTLYETDTSTVGLSESARSSKKQHQRASIAAAAGTATLSNNDFSDIYSGKSDFEFAMSTKDRASLMYTNNPAQALLKRPAAITASANTAATGISKSSRGEAISNNSQRGGDNTSVLNTNDTNPDEMSLAGIYASNKTFSKFEGFNVFSKEKEITGFCAL